MALKQLDGLGCWLWKQTRATSLVLSEKAFPPHGSALPELHLCFQALNLLGDREIRVQSLQVSQAVRAPLEAQHRDAGQEQGRKSHIYRYSSWESLQASPHSFSSIVPPQKPVLRGVRHSHPSESLRLEKALPEH